MSQKRGVDEFSELVESLPRIYKKLCDESTNVQEVTIIVSMALGNFVDKIAAETKTGTNTMRAPPKRDQRKVDHLLMPKKDVDAVFDGHARSRLGEITYNTECPGTYWRTKETLTLIKEGRILIIPGQPKIKPQSYLKRINCGNHTNSLVRGPKISPTDTDRPYICKTCKTAYYLDVKRGLIIP